MFKKQRGEEHDTKRAARFLVQGLGLSRLGLLWGSDHVCLGGALRGFKGARRWKNIYRGKHLIGTGVLRKKSVRGQSWKRYNPKAVGTPAQQKQIPAGKWKRLERKKLVFLGVSAIAGLKTSLEVMKVRRAQRQPGSNRV